MREADDLRWGQEVGPTPYMSIWNLLVNVMNIRDITQGICPNSERAVLESSWFHRKPESSQCRSSDINLKLSSGKNEL